MVMTSGRGEGMRIEKVDGDSAALWLRMAFFAMNPGVEAEDDWGIELPADGASEAAPEEDALRLRTVSY
jgi:hypothetical protein